MPEKANGQELMLEWMSTIASVQEQIHLFLNTISQQMNTSILRTNANPTQ